MAVAVRSSPSREQPEHIPGVSPEIVGSPEAHSGQEQQGEQQSPPAIGVVVVPPAIVGGEVLGQRRFQRLDQPRLVGSGQEQEMPRPLDRALIFTRPIFPPPLGN